MQDAEMSEVETPAARNGRLPKNLIKEIFMFLPSAQIFQQRLYALNRQFYNDGMFIDKLFSQFLMQKLGVLTDFGFELEYFKRVLRRHLDMN
jgi:hypothetical protein